MMPLVTDCETAIGQPIARTTSPTLAWSELPHEATARGAAGRLRESSFSFKTAISAMGSVPIRTASISSPLERLQIMRVALPATWWLVTT